MSDEHYLKYQRMIAKAAWQRVERNRNLDLQELISEGNLAYCEARESFDPDLGAFSTHLTWRLRHRLGKANEMAICYDNHTEALDDMAERADPTEGGGGFQTALDGLGAEAKEVASLVLGSAGELCDFTCSSVKVTVGRLRKHFRSLDWPHLKINAAIDEIRMMLRNL